MVAQLVKEKYDITLVIKANYTRLINLYITREDGNIENRPQNVIFFFNGFKCQARWYNYYAEQLALAGFVVIQYDTPFNQIIDDQEEVQFFPQLLEQVRIKLMGKTQLSRIGLVGRSRGGKLAALIYSQKVNDDVKALYLIDPIDTTKWAPETDKFPSAVTALKGQNVKMGITGAGIITSCNPECGNFRKFYEVCDKEQSKLKILENVGHMQFCQIPAILKPITDFLASSGRSVSVKEVMEAVLKELIPWMQASLR